MKYWSHLSIVILCSLLPLSPSTAQKTHTKPEPNGDAELQQRRATAMSMLQSLAIEARSYRNEALRARVQARIADVIWTQDKEGARALFRRAWEVAEAVDQAATESNPGRRSNTGRVIPARASLRREVLLLAARRDHKLGEEFLVKLTPTNPNQTKSTQEVSSSESAERLIIASQFLETGNVERALQFADPGLRRITERTILFLVALREKDLLAADQRFGSLLSIASADPGSDANTVSLLTSYVFTPSTYLIVSPSGIPSRNSYEPRQLPDLAQPLRRRYFEVAASILLRPIPQMDESSAGRAGTRLIMSRLMPLFDRFASDLGATLRAQLAAMGTEATTAYAVPELELNAERTDNSGQASVDKELKEGLERAQDVEARDRVYAFAAMRAADQADPRAHDFADKIEDSETRKGVTTFVDYSFIRTLIQKKRANEAASLIHRSNLPYTLRAQYLTQAATLMLKDDRVRALELYEEALTNTRRIDAATQERAYSLVALLRQFATFDRTRTWELLSETVKAANSVSEFTGEYPTTSFMLEGKFMIRLSTELASRTDLAETFEALAIESFYQALDLSKSFTGDAPRAIATIAIARAVLQDPLVNRHHPL